MGALRALLDDVWDAFHGGDYDRGMSHYSADCEVDVPGIGTMGKDDWENVVRAHFTGHSDFAVRITDSVEDDDTLSFLWTATGTHDGDIAHVRGVVPPTGAPLDVGGAGWVEVKDGLITRYHLFFNAVDYFEYQKMLGDNAHPAD